MENFSIPELGKAARAERRKQQEGKMPEFKLMIATPYYMQQELSWYGDAMLETVRFLDKAGIQWQKQSLNGDSYIDRAKNSILANFLESDCTDILMIDSDMSWGPDAVARMVRHTQEVVGGFFPMKNAWQSFAGALLPDENGQVPDLKSAIELWDGSCLFKAHLIPGGFLRLKRSVLERFADQYPEVVYQDPCADPSKPERVYTAFFECLTHNYVRFGEDATFCRRLREMDVDLWCDPNISFGHFGMKGFSGNFHQFLLKPAEEIEALMKERASAISAVRVQPEEVAS